MIGMEFYFTPLSSYDKDGDANCLDSPIPIHFWTLYDVCASFVLAYDLHVFVCHCGRKEDQLYPDDGQSRCFYRPI